MQPLAWILIWGGISAFAVILFAIIALELVIGLRGLRRDLAKLAAMVDPVVAGSRQFSERLEKTRADIDRIRALSPLSTTHSEDN